MHDSKPVSLKQAVLKLQIITIALLIGALNICLILVLFKMGSPDGQALNAQLDVLAILVLVIALPMIVASFAVPMILQRKANSVAAKANMQPSAADLQFLDPLQELSADETQLLNLYSTSHIVGCAVLEGLSMLASIAFFITGSVFCLAIAVMAMVLLATKVPSVSKVHDWMQQRIRDASLR